MSGSPKETLRTKLEETETDETEEREVSLKDGRTLVLSERGTDQLVEIRNESGLVEVRIQLTEQGPVLQMEVARMQLKATEQVTIESERVELKGSKSVAIEGGQVDVDAKEDLETGTNGEVRVRGKTIWLN